MADRVGMADPYAIVDQTLRDLHARGLAVKFTGQQMGQAAVCAAGMLAALGVEPAVAGDAAHPDALRGRALVDLVGDWRAAPTGPGGGGRGADVE